MTDQTCTHEQMHESATMATHALALLPVPTSQANGRTGAQPTTRAKEATLDSVLLARVSLGAVRTGCAPCSPHTACARRSRNHSRNTSTYRYTHRPHTWHSHRAHGAHGHGESSVKVGSPTPSLLEYTHIYGMPLQSQGIAARLGRPRSNRQHKRRGIRSAALLAPDALRRPLRVFRRVGSHPKRLPQGRVLDVALPKLFA
jgi:hypothetical protein